MFTGSLSHEDDVWKTQNGGSSHHQMLISRPRTAYQNDICQLLEIRFLFVHIFHKYHNLYSVTEQDAIFCCLKVLQLKQSFSFHMALSGVSWILLLKMLKNQCEILVTMSGSL